MDPIEYLRWICEDCNGSVVVAEMPVNELMVLIQLQGSRLVHTIAGLAIVTVEGWAACSGNR
jgi:hypothetical protein